MTPEVQSASHRGPSPSQLRLPCSCGMGLLARLVAFTEYGFKPDFGLAACRVYERDVCTVDCLGSPLRALHHELLSIHMVDHVLLMAVAPPLILLGAPFRSFVHGLPTSSIVRGWRGFCVGPSCSGWDAFWVFRCFAGLPPQSPSSDGMFRLRSNWACGPICGTKSSTHAFSGPDFSSGGLLSGLGRTSCEGRAGQLFYTFLRHHAM